MSISCLFQAFRSNTLTTLVAFTSILSGPCLDGDLSICFLTRLTLQHEFLKVGIFTSLVNRNSIFSSPTPNVSFPCLTSISALTVARKGRLNRIRISVSSRMSIITKFIEMISLHILIYTTSAIPTSYLADLSPICRDILVVLQPPRPSFS